MNAPNTIKPLRRSLVPIALLALAAAFATYYFWSRFSASPDDQDGLNPEAALQGSPASTTGAQARPNDRHFAGEGIEVDANGARILNEAGLPDSGVPLPVAKPIPIKAAPSEIIGYKKDANGEVTPIRAGELDVVPNSPGTYAVVDMWAEGGPAVVPATRGTALSPEELAKLREAEAKSERIQR
ncbi:MAG: hypothetical protein U1A73_09945 [Pseudomonas sp.]|nr:hypothetical protein [Pseudomonas sp.]